MLARLRHRFRGPRLGTKLALMGLALLIVPWFSYRQLVEMERLHKDNLKAQRPQKHFYVIQWQRHLFNDLPLNRDDFEPRAAA